MNLRNLNTSSNYNEINSIIFYLEIIQTYYIVNISNYQISKFNEIKIIADGNCLPRCFSQIYFCNKHLINKLEQKYAYISKIIIIFYNILRFSIIIRHF